MERDNTPIISEAQVINSKFYFDSLIQPLLIKNSIKLNKKIVQYKFNKKCPIEFF